MSLSQSKKRMMLGFSSGFLAVNGARRLYRSVLVRKRQRQFRAYLKTDPAANFSPFHRGSVYGYKHTRSTSGVYFAVRNLSDERFIVRRRSMVWGMPEKYQLTDFDYNFLSDFAYYVDDQMALRAHFEPITAGESFDDRFQVVETIDDDETGLQAMAVQVSRSQIVIAYAGTNPLDARDIKTDMVTIIAKENLPNRANTQQHERAEAFYQAIRTAYPEARLTLTGHSLGGFLALYVACRQRVSATVFNAPDPWELLDDLPQNLDLTNYRHAYDAMGNFAGNGTGAECLSHRLIPLARTPFVYHGLATWRFDKNGKIER
jgi:hypothetical protein